MNLFLEAAGQLFTWGTFQWVLVGVVAGLFIGLVPGLGGVTFISIALPFMLVMPFHQALGLMVGFMAVGTTSDTIPAVLIAIPGANAGQATVLDGHAMARQGLAARALGASFTAAVGGGIVGALALLLSVPILRPLVLSFGYPEFFMLGLWGITMVGRLAKGAAVKGLIMGGIGLLLGSIGSEAQSGFARWHFNQTFLLDGVDLGVLAMAVFAIPELVSLAVRRTSVSDVPPVTDLVHGQLAGARDTIRNWGTVVRGGLIGAYVSAIPGMGGGVASWIAYGVTVQTARDKSRFGHGDVRGVIGPDSAANASDGGSLIPTLGFGVPGSGGMAFLLVVFASHGVQTGSSLLTTRLDIIYFFVIGLVVANIIGATICFFTANQLAKLSYAPYYYLFALFVPIMFLSAYHATEQVGNLLVLVIGAAIAYMLRQFGWPRPPLLLGFVLAPILESNLASSVALYGTFGWVTRPIVLVLAAVIVLPFVARLPRKAWASFGPGRTASGESSYRWRGRRGVRGARLGQHAGGGVPMPGLDLNDAPSDVLTATTPDEPDQGFDLNDATSDVLTATTPDEPDLVTASGRRVTWFRFLDVTLNVVLMAVLALGLWQARSWPDDAKRFPMVVGMITMALLAFQVLNRLRRLHDEADEAGAAFEMPSDVENVGMVFARRSAIEFGWLLALLVGVWIFGLAIVLPVFTFIYLRVVGHVKWRYCVLTTIGFALFVWALFDQLAHVFWYKGMLFG